MALFADDAVADPRPDWWLRWFTPTTEVELCGHATLASGYVVLRELQDDADTVQFSTRSGRLTVRDEGDRLAMDLPRLALQPGDVNLASDLADALACTPVEVLRGDRDVVAVLDSQSAVAQLLPDMGRLQRVAGTVTVTAAADRADPDDFVLRFFGPGVGIPEDPVTGSAQCTIAPYWAERLGKRTLHSTQLSSRRGRVVTEVHDEWVRVSGSCALYLKGSVHLGDDAAPW